MSSFELSSLKLTATFGLIVKFNSHNAAGIVPAYT